MPIYEFKCKKCRKITEEVFPVNECPEKIKCSCGKTAKKILSRGFVRCDGENNIIWFESSKATLPDDAQHIETRGGREKYLKEHNLICVG